MNRKILVSMDGSDQALDAVRYISGIFSPEKTTVVLFHVSTEVPESFLDMRKEAAFRSTMPAISAWATQIKRNIEEFMENARKILLDAGYPSEAVLVKVQSKKVGVARDIIKESYDGFDAVVMGRSGVSRLKDVVVGSVANKLITKMPHIPIVAVGGNPDSAKLIIGFDGSESAMKAVDCAASLLCHPEREVMLCHVIRPLNIHLGIKKLFNSKEEAEWIAANINEITPFLIEAEKRLKDGGFPAERISKEIMKERKSRAQSITAKAESEGYGTIVVGRRGLTVVEDFIIGRVSRKVLHMADEMAVWIV